MAAGALGFALAANWPCALAASLLCGLGAGAVDYGRNYLFSIGFGKRSPAMLGILNAHCGLGIERFGDTIVPWLLAAVSAACVLLALKLTLIRALTNNSIVDELVAGR